MSLSSAWPPCTMTAVAAISAAASQVSCRILRDGIRTRLLADATLIRYGACTYSGMVDSRSRGASSRGLGFFQLCGLPRKNCTASAPSASAAARGSSRWTCEPMSTRAKSRRAVSTARRTCWLTAKIRPRFRSQRTFGAELAASSCYAGACVTIHADCRRVGVSRPNALADPPDAPQFAPVSLSRGGIYAEQREHCGDHQNDHQRDEHRSHGTHRQRLRRSRHEKAPGDAGGSFDLVSGSRCSRSRPAEPRLRWPGRSRGCSTDPRKTGSCTPRPAPLRSAAPGCCGTG